MAEPYGFTITAKGWQLLAQLVQGGCSLNICRIAFGKGSVPAGTNPADLEDLTDFVANGSSSTPIITEEKDENGELLSKTISFVAEYRSNGDEAQFITYDFYLKEFGIFALDPDTNEEIMIYYGTLGDYPQHVSPFENGAIDIRRFPVSIVLSSEMEVNLLYPPAAFVTWEEMVQYANDPCKPEFLRLSQEQIDVHNVSHEAHPDIRALIRALMDRIGNLERIVIGDDSITFRFDFDSLDGIVLESGVWDKVHNRIAF